VVDTLCAWVEQLGGDPAAAAETRVSKEPGKPVIRRDDPPGLRALPVVSSEALRLGRVEVA